MKNFLSKRIGGYLLLLICNCCLCQIDQSIEINNTNYNGKSATHRLNISAAGFKPRFIYNDVDRVVSELNGCYANVNYSGVDLPVDAWVTAIEPHIFVATDQVEVLDVVFSATLLPNDSVIINQQIEVNNGYNSQLIRLQNGHLVDSQDVMWVHFPNLSSEDIMLCGMTFHYIPDGDVIFRNGFD